MIQNSNKETEEIETFNKELQNDHEDMKNN